jgi:putative membrane protein
VEPLVSPVAREPYHVLNADDRSDSSGNFNLQEVSMPRTFLRYAATGAIAFTLVLVTSCNPREGDTPGRTGDAPAPGDPGAAAATGADTGALTDANIVALLDEANQADSAAGAYAMGKATNPDVKAFAKLMISEHHALRLQGQQLAKRLNVTPQPPANDPVKAAAESEMAALRAAPKGPAFDRTYIEQEVAIHKAVLDLADQAHDATQNQELKALIEQAKPIIEKHRDRAEEIQKKLGKPSA